MYLQYANMRPFNVIPQSAKAAVAGGISYIKLLPVTKKFLIHEGRRAHYNFILSPPP